VYKTACTDAQRDFKTKWTPALELTAWILSVISAAVFAHPKLHKCESSNMFKALCAKNLSVFIQTFIYFLGSSGWLRGLASAILFEYFNRVYKLAGDMFEIACLVFRLGLMLNLPRLKSLTTRTAFVVTCALIHAYCLVFYVWKGFAAYPSLYPAATLYDVMTQVHTCVRDLCLPVIMIALNTTILTRMKVTIY
jgi:hypothetical protein